MMTDSWMPFPAERLLSPIQKLDETIKWAEVNPQLESFLGHTCQLVVFWDPKLQTCLAAYTIGVDGFRLQGRVHEQFSKTFGPGMDQVHGVWLSSPQGWESLIQDVKTYLSSNILIAGGLDT